MNELIQLFTNTTIETQLLAASLVILSLNILLLLFKNHSSKKSAAVEELQRDLRALSSAALGMGGRIIEIERRYRLIKTTQPKANSNTRLKTETNTKTKTVQPVVIPQQSIPPMQPVANSSQYYDHAIRMAQQGAKPQDIERACGLSQSEAELINVMHRLDKAG